MKNAFASLFTTLLFVCLASEIVADDHHPIVPGFERFSNTEAIEDVERGMLLLNELNCNSCHKSNSTWSVHPKQAPILTNVGDRVLPQYFESFLLDPHGTKPGTTMPDVLVGKTEAEKKSIAESISHFLASTGDPTQQLTSSADTLAGEELFHSIGCVACHDPQNKDVSIGTSIPFGKLETKYKLTGLTKFIQDPTHVRPSGRMPKFNLTDNEARDIALYLLRDVVVNSKINASYYHGRWETLPDFEKAEKISTTIVNRFTTQGWKRHTHFGLVYTGFWATPRDATYRFRVTSDDGSHLTIDGQVVVDHDGIHAMTTKEGEIELAAGMHEVVVEYFENDGGEGLKVDVFGDGIEGASLDSLLQATKEGAKPRQLISFVVDAAKVKLGEQYFQSVGCANCHELSQNDVAFVSTLSKQTDLDAASATKGCLLNDAGSVSYGLSEYQVKCLTAALNELARRQRAGELATSAEQAVHEKFLTHNCYACHNRQMSDRSIRGGVVDVRGDSEEIYGRKDWFTSTQVEMGDEGQHPPALTSIGSKMNPEWFHKVLTEGIKSRPYMNTRMPMFGDENLATLENDLIALDKLENVVEVAQSEDARKVKSHGRFFSGDEALSCIKCHTFGKFQATGIQAIDLTTMTKRLNKDWFQAYMLKPSKFRRGTRMPESWPGGKSFYPDILDGDTPKQIDAIWQFLSDGEKAAKPKGLIRSKMELKAVDTPKIYRNFIEGAGPRAIGVGYPEQVNIAFDAELCRLALVWQENFIDASRHWTGRGQGFEPPLGENILVLPNSVVFSTSADLGSFTGESSIRPEFKGYRFDKDRRPIFTYELGDVVIEDQPIPYSQDDHQLLKRRFKFTSTNTKKLYYLVAKGDTPKFDDRWTTEFGTNLKVKPDSKTNRNEVKFASGDLTAQGDLIFEIDLSNGSAELEQTYDW